MKIHLVVVALLMSLGSLAQVGHVEGAYLLENYPPKVYHGNSQVFDIGQDDRGMMFYANNVGVLQYDGVNWRKITLDGQIYARKITKGPDGRIYVGADGGFGVLEPDDKGLLQFSSLTEEYNLGDSIGEIGQVNWFGNDLYIRGNQDIWIVSAEGTKHIRTESEIQSMYYCNKRIFVCLKDVGLFDLIKGELELVNDGHFFFNKDIRLISKIKERTIVVCESGLYELGAGDTIIDLGLYNEEVFLSAIMVEDRYLSLGTFTNGIIVLDTDLNELRRVGLEDGLQDPQIKCQFVDKEKNLWLGTNVGITRIEMETPISQFSKSKGVNSVPESISDFDNSLYLATQNGLYFFNKEKKIEKLPVIQRDCYGLRSFTFDQDTLLFIAELDAVISLDKNGKYETITPGGPYEFKRNPLDSNEIIVVHFDGISNVFYENGKFRNGEYFRNFPQGEPFNFEITLDGTIWIGTKQKEGIGGIYRTHVDEFHNGPSIDMKLYTNEDGLPTQGANYIFSLYGEIFSGSKEGVYRYNSETDRFEVFDGFGISFSTAEPKLGVHRVMVDSKNNVWMMVYDDNDNFNIGYSTLHGSEYEWISTPFNRHEEEVVHAFYEDSRGIIWMGGTEGLFRYSPIVHNSFDIHYHAMINEVQYGDSLVFGGAYSGPQYLSNGDEQFEFPFLSSDGITFHYSGTSFIDEKSMEYSYQLEGFDDNWSDWSSRTLKEFNLTEGVYTFHVRCRNIYGVEGEIASFRFKILPPWYRTTWAYVLFFIAFILLVYFVVKLSIRRVRQQNIKLEAIVDERTIEVVAQKAEAEKQRDIAEHQKELVEEKNKEILDSISYAKRLQEAILPPDKLMKDSLPENFVLYKPKDIVAGDFYWMEKVKNSLSNQVLFAAADCTGHGVPGAMVSVVCSNALDRTVKEFGIVTPGLVLDKVTDLVIETFEKSEDEVKDGMDIALCSLQEIEIDGKQKFELKYSGANNPLWIVSKRTDVLGDVEPNISYEGVNLFELKATKQPVGQYAERKAFETHTLILEPGDIFYLFSDGFADQFGGDRGKKYKYKPFKRFLLSVVDKPLKDQKEILSEEFEMWKGEFEQVDDVCVMAVRV